MQLLLVPNAAGTPIGVPSRSAPLQKRAPSRIHLPPSQPRSQRASIDINNLSEDVEQSVTSVLDQFLCTRYVSCVRSGSRGLWNSTQTPRTGSFLPQSCLATLSSGVNTSSSQLLPQQRQRFHVCCVSRPRTGLLLFLLKALIRPQILHLPPPLSTNRSCSTTSSSTLPSPSSTINHPPSFTILTFVSPQHQAARATSTHTHRGWFRLDW